MAALLAHAERVELTLGRAAAGQLDRIRTLAEVERVDVDLVAEAGRRAGRRARAGRCVRLLGAPGAAGGAVRGAAAGAVGPQIEDGAATVLVRGRRGRLRLSGETLDALAAAPRRVRRPGRRLGDPGRLGRSGGLAEGSGRARHPCRAGWCADDPEPRAWAAGLLVPDLLVRPAGRDGLPGVLVCLVRTAAQAARLARCCRRMRGGEPLLFAGPDPLLEPLREAGGWTVELPGPALGAHRGGGGGSGACGRSAQAGATGSGQQTVDVGAWRDRDVQVMHAVCAVDFPMQTFNTGTDMRNVARIVRTAAR